MATAAELAILIKAKDEATAVLKKVASELGGVDKAGAEASKGLGGLGGAFKVAGAAAAGITVAAAGVTALAAALAPAVSAAIGFEQSMSAIKAVSGATGDQMKQLSSLALDLGKSTSFSASQAAAGIEELLKGGVSIGDVFGGAAAASLDLAAAGGVSVGEAATIASNALNQFNLKGTDMAHVADLVAGAANASSISVSDFNQSLAAGGSVAALAGQSIDSFATAVALMGAQGIKGSDAGTSLKAALNNLIPTTDAAKAKMQELGLITADGTNQFINASGGMKSFGEIAEILQTQTAGLTESQRLLALELIFGSDGMRAAGVLAKQGGEGFDAMAASMEAAGGAAAVAQERLNNAAGDIEELKGSLETAGIVIGSLFIPAIRSIATSATAAVNTFTQEASTIIATAQNIASEHGIGLIPAALTAVELRIGEVFGPRAQAVFHAARAAVELLAEGFGTVADFVGEAVPRVLDFVGGALDAAQQSGVLQAALESVGGAVTAVAGFIEANILPAVEALVDRFTAFASEVAPLVESAFAGIQNIVATVLSAVGALIQNNLALFQAQWAEHGATVMTIVGALWGALSGIVEAGLTVIGGTIKTILAIISGDWQGAWETMIATATAALGQLAGAIGALAGPIGAKAAEIGQAIINGLANAIRGGIGAVTQAAAGVAQAALNAAKAQLGVASPSKEFEEIGENVVQGLADGIDGTAGAAVAAVEDMVAEMQDAASGLNLVDQLLGGLDSGGQETVARFVRDVDDLMEDVGRKAEEIGRKAAESIADAREDAARAIEDVREGAASRALDLVDNQGLSREIRAVRERFGEQQDEAARAYDQQREDADATYKFERDLARAKTDDEKEEVRARFKDAQDDLRRRRDQEEADRAFKRQQNADLQAFNDRLEDEALQRQIKRLQNERDERIAQITEALDEKTRKVLDQEAREREALRKSADEKLDDLRRRFYDKIGELNQDSKDKFEALFKSIQENAEAATKAANALAEAINKAANAKAPTASGSRNIGTPTTWENQTQAVRDMFIATWGAENAKSRWEEEHARELGVTVGTQVVSPSGGGGGGSAPSQTSDVHAPGFDWGAYNAANQGKPRNPDGTVRNAYGDHPLAAGQASRVGETGWAETFVPNVAGRLVTQDQIAMAVTGGQHGGDGGYWEHTHPIYLNGRQVAEALEPDMTGAQARASRLVLG